jgi:flagellin-like protein
MLNNKRKGISPLIAAVLLIVFVIGLGTVILAWLNTYAKDTTVDTTEKTDVIISCSGAIVEIQSLYLLNGTAANEQDIKMVVSNRGTPTIFLREASLYNRTGDVCNLDIPTEYIENGVETGSSVTLSIDGCAHFLNNDLGDCSDLDLAVITTSCDGTRDRIRSSTESRIVCRH